MATMPREQLLPLPPRHPIPDEQIAPRLDGPTASPPPLRPRVMSAGLASGALGAPLVGLAALLAVGAVAGGVLPGLGSMPAQHGLPGSPAGMRAGRQLNGPELAGRASASPPARIPLLADRPTPGSGFRSTGAGFTPGATGLTHSPRRSSPARQARMRQPTQAPLSPPSPTAAAQPAPTAAPGPSTSTPAQPTPASTDGGGSQTPNSSTTPTTTTTPSGGSQTQPTSTAQSGEQSDGDRHRGGQTTTSSSGQTTTAATGS
jgi:hypothetical protein